MKEGQTVQKGDTLALLEAPDIAAKMEQARAAEAAAQAQNEKAIKGARQEQIQAAYEMWQKAQAAVEIAEKSYKRVKNLFDQGVMPAQKLDEVTAQRNAAIATEKAAKAQYTMAKNGAEREDKLAAAALVPWGVKIFFIHSDLKTIRVVINDHSFSLCLPMSGSIKITFPMFPDSEIIPDNTCFTGHLYVFFHAVFFSFHLILPVKTFRIHDDLCLIDFLPYIIQADHHLASTCDCTYGSSVFFY